MQWCDVVLLNHFGAEKGGSLSASPVQLASQEVMLFLLSLLSNVYTRIAAMGTADRRDIARGIPKFAADFAGEDCMRAFPWQQWLW